MKLLLVLLMLQYLSEDCEAGVDLFQWKIGINRYASSVKFDQKLMHLYPELEAHALLLSPSSYVSAYTFSIAAYILLANMISCRKTN